MWIILKQTCFNTFLNINFYFYLLCLQLNDFFIDIVTLKFFTVFYIKNFYKDYFVLDLEYIEYTFSYLYSNLSNFLSNPQLYLYVFIIESLPFSYSINFFVENIDEYLIIFFISLLKFTSPAVIFFSIFDLNFYLSMLFFYFIFVIFFSNNYFYKSLNLYIYLLIIIFFLVYFNYNSYIGFILLVELMTITFIVILVLHFSNYFNFFKNQNLKNFIILFIPFSFFFSKTYMFFYDIESLYFSYYEFYFYNLTNDFIGLYIYFYFDNLFFLFFCAVSFVFITIMLINIIFHFFKTRKNDIIYNLYNFRKYFFQKTEVYEKTYFWEKDFFDSNKIFK